MISLTIKVTKVKCQLHLKDDRVMLKDNTCMFYICYPIMPPFETPRKEAFRKHLGKGENAMLVTCILSIFHNVFSPLTLNHTILTFNNPVKETF